jgi:DNA-binding response OmpR family regulator
LVVDDQAVIRELVKEALELWREGLEIEEAEDGMEAIVNLECRQYDLMICDVKMPVLDGIGVLKKVREQASTRDLPVIMLTGETDPEQIVGALNLGATSYITKPFNLDELLSALNTYAPGVPESA